MMWYFIRLFLLFLSLYSISLSSQAVILINSTSDNPPATNPNDSSCTLREAITAANLAWAGIPNINTDCTGAAASLTANTLQLDTSLGASPLITLTSELPPIASSLILQPAVSGPAGNFVIAGTPSSRIVEISSGAVQFVDLSLVNGHAVNGGALFIDSDGQVTLKNVAVQGNSVTASGGGIYNDSGQLTLTTNSIVKANSAVDSGGGIYNSLLGSVTIDASQVGTTAEPNTVTNPGGGGTSKGGGIANVSGFSLSIINGSKVCGNSVTFNSGNALGGGIYSSDSTVTISNTSEVCNNTTTSAGGQSYGAGIYSNSTVASVTDLNIQSGSKIYGNNTGGATSDKRGGGIYHEGLGDALLDAAFVGMDTSLSSAPNISAYGGGIYNLNTNMTIQNNSQVCYNQAQGGNTVGGGIYNDHSGSIGKNLLINKSIFCFNSTNGTISSAGGAIGNYGSSAPANLVIQNASQFYGNEAKTSGAAYNVGGAIYNNSSAGVTIDNTTIGTATSPNKAQDGAGIYQAQGLLTIQNNSAINYNVASANGAGIYNLSQLAVSNSVFSYNNAANVGGAIKNGSGGTVTDLSSTKLIYNLANTGAAFYQDNPASTTIGINNCVVGNNSTDDVHNVASGPLNFSGVWWGSNDGASGAATGNGDSIGTNINQGTFLTAAPTGCPSPLYSSTPATGMINLGVAALGASTSGIINLAESGSADLIVSLDGGSLTTALTGADVADFAVTGTFPISIAKGASLTSAIAVKCTPSAVGTRTATLTLRTNASTSPTNNDLKVYTLQCSTPPPSSAGFSSSPAATAGINFGNVNLGSSGGQTIVIAETGNAALNVNLNSLVGANASDFTVSGLPMTIADGTAAQNISVTCSPSALGTRSANLVLNTNDSVNSSVTYTLSCNGVSAPVPTNPIFNSMPTPSVGVSFGNVSTAGATQTISITNPGTATLSVSLSGISGTNAGDFSVSGLPVRVLNGGAAQNITLTCKPAATGLRTATLTLNTNDTTQPSVSYALQCNGIVTGTVCDKQTQIPVTQCNVLLDLYNRTNGAAWTDSANNQWTKTTQPCSWTGVSCAGGQVVGLNRSQQNLVGALPNLNALVALVSLNLADNQISGLLPSFSGFSNLQNLNLGGNLFNGIIPSLPISLISLALDNNQLEGTIPDLTTLTSLNSLKLDFNKFTAETAGSASLKQAVWRATQTIMPTNVKATALSGSQVQLTWTPISYATDSGYYQVRYATTVGGSYTTYPTTTPDKSTSSLVVAGLTANTTYYFVVETVTMSHLRQRSLLVSIPSAGVSAKTTTGTVRFSSVPAFGSTLNVGVADFGNPSTTSLTVINLSSSALTVSTSITGTNASDFSVTPTSTTIAGSTGATQLKQLFVVQCHPLTSVGTLNASLTLTVNDPAQPTVSYPLTCQSNNKLLVNNAPTDISLSNNSISETLAGGGLIGLLNTQDPDVGDSFTYTLVNNAGTFTLNGNELHVMNGISLDGIAHPSYSIKVRSTDSGGLFIDKSFTISVLSALNSVFTGEIASESGTIASKLSLEASENFKVLGHIQPDNRHVGLNASIFVTYTWTIAGTTPRVIPVTLAKNQILSAKMDLTLFQGNLTGLSGTFNVRLSYRLDDGREIGGDIATLELLANHTPSDISLSNNSVSENSVEGSLIGKLSTTDADVRDHFTYGLVSTQQFLPFKIVGDELRVANTFLLNAKTTPQYQLKVRSVDSFGGYVEKDFVITIQSADSLPTKVGLTNSSVLESSHYGTVVGRLFTQERNPYSYQYTLLDDAGGRFAVHDDLLIVANGDLLQYEIQAQHTVNIRSTNVSTGKTLDQSFTINLINIPNIHVTASLQDSQGNPVDKTSFSAAEFLNLSVRLYPEFTHRGKTVDLILVAVVVPNTAPNEYILAMLGDDLNFAAWDGDFAHLHGAGKLLLDTQHDFQLWNGPLPALDGTLALYLGYRLDTGEVFYQPQPLILEIH